MSRLTVIACEPEDFPGFVARTGAIASDARGIKAVDSCGKVHGMVVFERWTQTSCVAHVALDSPIAARSLLEPAFRYPFEQCGRSILIGIVKASNEKALRLDLHVGFKEVGRIRDGFAHGDDLVLLEMRKEDCRYLKRRKAA